MNHLAKQGSLSLWGFIRVDQRRLGFAWVSELGLWFFRHVCNTGSYVAIHGVFGRRERDKSVWLM